MKMDLRYFIEALSLLFFSSIAIKFIECFHVYSHQFVVEVLGGPEIAKQVAKEHGFEYLGHIFGDYYHLHHKRVVKRSLHKSLPHHELLSSDTRVKTYSQQVIKKRVKRDLKGSADLNDPKWPEMWYLNRGWGFDMNVQSAWATGATGKGVVVTILDDGLEKDHPDLVFNYDPDASCDINDHDFDPQPRYDKLDSNRHGTRCAGEVAASANNSLCSVGIAYGARVGGIRMLDGDVTDAVEARSLSHNSQHIHIYSASWGPDDNGKTVDGPSDLAFQAFQEGVENGRGGLGSIFIWASGNGGREFDNCNCDGYTNSIYTLSISSATEHGLVPWYSEACSSTLATTYSSGSSGEKQVVTTDLHHGCTSTHTGTSASAPLAAGICALTLDANPKLTWRDMQHIVVRTANPSNLFARDWVTNGVGRNVSHSFGYGMMDAGAMVGLARMWMTVPEQKICEIRGRNLNQHIHPRSKVEAYLSANCSQVRYIEHVQARITVTASRRGELHIYVTSPMGTRSMLLAQRPPDTTRGGFNNWPFMSVHMWGENPNGLWKLEVSNDGRTGGRAGLKDWNLVIYGTTENPDEFIFERKLNRQRKRPKKEPSLEDPPFRETRKYFNGHKIDVMSSKKYGTTRVDKSKSNVGTELRFEVINAFLLLLCAFIFLHY
ncbi:furin-like protease 1, isoforms 1/1-X/2 [Parasteatoda tepidariorum]|nr:furin-like protease 1, isoforms 1/1-X/2 [Parasteatoda tepidariorum]